MYCISNSVGSTISSLSHGLALCAKWCNTNETIIHPTKCEAMIISNTCLKGPTPQLTIKPGFHIITQDRLRSSFQNNFMRSCSPMRSSAIPIAELEMFCDRLRSTAVEKDQLRSYENNSQRFGEPKHPESNACLR